MLLFFCCFIFLLPVSYEYHLLLLKYSRDKFCFSIFPFSSFFYMFGLFFKQCFRISRVFWSLALRMMKRSSPRTKKKKCYGRTEAALHLLGALQYKEKEQWMLVRLFSASLSDYILWHNDMIVKFELLFSSK